jgi:cytochrome c-type biogenesis protein CcmH
MARLRWYGAAVVVSLGMLSAALPAAQAGEAPPAADVEQGVHAIAQELMCPVCGGQTVAESNSRLAEQMRATIRERVLAGQSRDEIIAYFVAQFGESVLAAPRARGGGLILWLVPPLALLAGAVVVVRFVRRSLAPRAA